MKSIFDKVTLGKLQLKNRLIRSATWEGLANNDGHMPEALYKIYNELAGGGVGAIITGFTSVADNDYYFGGMARLSNDGLIEEHRRLVGISHSYDCPIIVQLALGEYNGAYRDMDIDRMTAEDFSAVREMFISAAVRGEKAGYDGVQIHAAHGFFLSRFISPAFNHRRDEYGGRAENRGRLVVEILKGIKECAPKLHVTMKINCQDFTPCGLTADDSMVICRTCAENGIDSIEVSGGGTSRSGIRAGANEAYSRDFAAELVETVDVPVILVGGHRNVECMENVLNDSKITCLSLSRPLVREPNLPNRWQNGDLRPAKCVSCKMCYQTPAHQCIFALSKRQ